MKHVLFGIGILVSIFMVLILNACGLPGFNFSTGNSNPDSPNTTPTITQTIRLPPIDPDFNIPTISAPGPSIDAIDFVSVIAQVRPSVVAIDTTVPTISIFGSSVNQQGAGSGWIIDSSGLIVTNNHVIEGANSITVTLEDGRYFTAEAVRADTVTDLAVVKINAQNLPPALKIGDSTDLRVGEWVVAIGNSLGQGISATKGIVSALGVSVSAETETLFDLIQTDAAINPGNSGGPLVDLSGEVVGINSIKVAQVGVEGMGYAISTKEAIPIIDDLVKTGYVIRPWMGVGLYTVDQTVVNRYRLGTDRGVLITQVASKSPASIAGLKAGDVITEIDGVTVVGVDDLTHIVREAKIGQQIQLTYYRGSNKSTASLTLTQSPPPNTP